MDESLKGYLNRKKFVKCEEVRFSDLKTTRNIYINPEKIITVEPIKIKGLDCSWVKLEDEKEEILINGEAEEFLYACKIDTFDFEGWDLYDFMNATNDMES